VVQVRPGLLWQKLNDDPPQECSSILPAPVTKRFSSARAPHSRYIWPISMSFGCAFWGTMKYRQVMIPRSGLTFRRGGITDYVNNFTWRYLRLAVAISFYSWKKENMSGSTISLCCSREPSAGRRAALGRIVDSLPGSR